MRINMWSGPRNLSTAMMYSFGARSDCAVIDEPFYAAYLHKTGIKHPMNDQILASQPTDPAQVANTCQSSSPDAMPIWYQKHMCQHMIDGFPLDWAKSATNIFLIRHPARVIASYAAKREAPTLNDIGFTQQSMLFDKLGGGIILDSADIRKHPEAMIKALCHAIGIPYEHTMLNWPNGPHKDDGVWASHWYGAVHNSTGFAAAEGPLPKLSGQNAETCKQALPHYETLAKLALKPA
ncbi:HAD family hydrolase [Amylibacter sp. SFDW26]|uniref:sulfotransferase-like domain-containing protein n=1 Tax=Amylibacter sp. SFDW26 TaxID=2652722 RepID=UPI001261BF1C|nr:HAD family hydrolase [Amylibacter sp. SFDW26]KAB7610488.1 HAD family hydrolase [Amylibacter sp. SFDW26]